MQKVIVLSIILVLFILPINIAIDYEAPPIAYCQHMGYSIESDSEGIPQCVFDDDSDCSAYDFYKGSCGEDKVKSISPRKEGEAVYTEFEECEEGLILSKPRYLLDQQICQKQSFLNDYLIKLKNILDIIF